MASQASGLVDAHVHLLDFMQETDGAGALIEAMDGAGVERAVVFGLPVKKKWAAIEPGRPGYYMDDIARCYYYALTDRLLIDQLLELPAGERTRLAPLACGVDPTDLSAVAELERLFDRFPGTWRGVGELLLRHGPLSARLISELPRPNHPGMRRIADFCAERRVPLLLHSNASPVGHAPEAYVPELEELLRASRRTTIVWAHAGLSESHRAHDHTATVRRLLSEHESLHVDISWMAIDDVLDDSGSLRPRWQELIEAFQDRVVLGTDSVGHFEHYADAVNRAARILAGLGATTRERVGRLNAARIWFGGEGS